MRAADWAAKWAKIVVAFAQRMWYYGYNGSIEQTVLIEVDMPRKPKPGPPVLRIESMSTGREYRPAAGVDDFTGQPIERVQDDRPARELTGVQEQRNAEHRAKRAMQRTLLANLGITHERPAKPKAKAFVRRF